MKDKMMERALNLFFVALSAGLMFMIYKNIKGAMGAGKGGGSDLFGFGNSNL
jgi:hypothetical protein